MASHSGRASWCAACMILLTAGEAAAQAVVDRAPNLSDGWTVPAGVIQFNFLHRFEVSAPPARKVTSFPNFQMAAGLPFGFNAALDYATNSTVFAGIPNEYQVSLRRPVLQQSRSAPVDLALTAGYNFSPQSVDGELSIGRRLGRAEHPDAVGGTAAWGAGAQFRIPYSPHSRCRLRSRATSAAGRGRGRRQPIPKVS